MATFEERVEGLTGLAITSSSSPTQAELTEFLKDGVLDVTDRIMSLRPEQSGEFVRISSASSSQGALVSDSGKLISVLRESGTDDDWRPARRVSIDKQSRVTDSSSLDYATKYNPVYILSEDGAVLVFPAPASSSTQYKLYYVNGTPTDVTNGASLAYTHSDIKYFPESKVYLVVLYAACQSLLNALSAKTIAETIPSWSAPAGFTKPTFSAPSLATVNALTLPAVPVSPAAPSFSTPTIQAITVGTMPDIDSTTLSNLGVPPTYTAPTVTGDGSELSSVDDLDTDNTIDVHADQIEFDQWWSTASHLIEDEEDIELAQVQLQKIRTYIEAYSTDMQSKLNTFNKEKAEYDGKLQEAIQQAQINAQKASAQAQIDASKVTTQAQLDAADAQQEAALLLQKENQEYAAKLQKYAGEVNTYQAEVNAKIQEWINEEWTQKFQKYTTDYANKLQTYANDIQNESLRFDKDIQKEAQAHAAAINEVAAEIQLDTSEYNWMSQRYAALKGQYDQAFGLMAPQEGKKD